MRTIATREELKAILDEWIPKYIRQVVELRSGGRLSAERYNELMNLLITQGDDTIELAETVKQYVEILVEEMETEFEVTTESVTNLANNAISTANSAVNTVEEYKTVINQDIASFKEVVNQATNTANNNANTALQIANQLVIDMEGYRTNLSTQVEETFTNMRNALGTQVTDEVEAQMQGIQEALTTDINATINILSEEVLTIANTAEQITNSAVQDIEAYKANMDVRLDAALKEVEDSLSVAGDVIQDASVIYAAIDELTTLVNNYEERITALEEFAESADETYAPTTHKHTKSEITDFPTSMPASDVYSWAKASSKPKYTASEVGASDSSHTHTSVIDNGNKTKAITFAYSSSGLSTTSWLAAWNDYELRAISPSTVKSVIGLGNVNNTADSDKSVKYATSAGSANAVAWGNVSGKPSSFTPASHTHLISQITGTVPVTISASQPASGLWVVP